MGGQCGQWTSKEPFAPAGGDGVLVMKAPLGESPRLVFESRKEADVKSGLQAEVMVENWSRFIVLFDINGCEMLPGIVSVRFSGEPVKCEVGCVKKDD